MSSNFQRIFNSFRAALFLLLVVILLTSCDEIKDLFEPEPTPSSPSGAVEGYVYAQITEEDSLNQNSQLIPLKGAEASISGTDLKSITDDKGYFKIEKVPVGYRRVYISATYYAVKYFDVPVNENRTSSLGIVSLPHIPKRWLVMIYFSADNSTEGADEDFADIRGATSSGDVDIVVQLDTQDQATKRYYISPKYTDPLEDIGEANMGDPKTLQDFMDWAKGAYPADNYLLIIWDHNLSDGWKMIAYDETSDDALTSDELEQALNGASIKVVAIDSSGKGAIEVAYQLKDVANYLVGSEELIPATGFPYQQILNSLVSNSSYSPSDVSEMIVEDYGDFYSSRFDPVTLSAIDLSAISGVALSSDAFGTEIRNSLEVNKAKYAIIKDELQTYDYLNPAWPYTSRVDLHHFAQLIKDNFASNTDLKNRAQEVIDSIDSAVISSYKLGVWKGDIYYKEVNSYGLAVYLNWTSQYNSDYSSATKFAMDISWPELCLWLDENLPRD